MKRLGPLLTLAAVAVLGIVLLVINMSKETEPVAAQPNSSASVTTSAAATAPGASTAPAASTTSTAGTPAPVPFPPQADYVGSIAVPSGTLTLSITVEGDKAIAYACDGNAIESWLQGSATGGTLQLTGKADAKLDGRHDGSVVSGALTIAGKQWPFTTGRVQSPAGLYVYTENGDRQSWIVDSYGAVTGVSRAANGATSAAPALAPDGTAIINGKKITAEKVSGGDSVR